MRRTVVCVAAANLGYFVVEFAVARRIESVSLFADSIEFLEDAALTFLVAVALAWPSQRRARVGLMLAALLLVPTLATAWAIWRKAVAPLPPEAWDLSATGFGALVVNLGCAFALARLRRTEDSLVRAAFLSARNDAIANVAIVAAGALTHVSSSGWPDLVVGVGIGVLNVNAAREVWHRARREGADTETSATPC